MRPWILLLLAVGGCASTYQYNDDKAPDTAATKDSGTWTESDTDSDSDSDTDTDSDSDTDTDTDTDTDPGTDTGLCNSEWDVVDNTGWVKDYNVEIGDLFGFGAGSGTARMESYGTDTFAGETMYTLSDTVSAGTMYAWSGVAYIRCNDSGNDGMYLYGWDVYVQGTPLALEFSAPRMYLPADSQIGTAGSWTYSYETYLDMGTGPTPVQISGEYNELGFESYSLPDGSSVSAYHLEQRYFVDGGTSGSNSGTLEQWWVEGLGLVKEVNEQDNGVTALVRELTSFSGLTPN